MELEGKEFFIRASGMMKHPRARDMFVGLSKQEQRHIEVLSHQLERLGRGMDISSLKDAIDVHESGPGERVFAEQDVKELGLSEGAGELEVIQVGLDVEQKSIEYYRKASAAATERDAKDMFDWLVTEEEGHLAILKAEYDNRSGSGFYYDDPQFSLETQ
jgi:rubrerythrin